MTTKALIVALALFAPVAAVAPGLMRREPDAVDVAMIQKPKSKVETGGECGADSDSNCCFTADAITQVNARHMSLRLKVGQCAAGAASIAGPENWKTLHKKMETCKTNVCQAQNVPKLHSEGTCSVYVCPKGYKAKKKTNPKAPCISATICNFNCCDVDINKDRPRKGGILTYAVLWAVTNVTKVSNEIAFPVRHLNEDLKEDMRVLNNRILGLYKVMNDISSTNKKYCPLQKKADDYSHLNHVRECVDMALCEMAKIERTREDLKVITLLREYYAKFEEVTWDNLWATMAYVEDVEKCDVNPPKKISDCKTMPRNNTDGTPRKSAWGNRKVDFMEAAELECIGLTPFLETLGQVSLLDKEKAGAHAVSKALIDAARATHALLNHHEDNDNSSMSATIAALHRAWEPACKLLNCDHTNYWDLVGASHSHSMALIESGASSNHMSVHVRTRVRLDIRVQDFLRSRREHASKILRVEGTRTEAIFGKYATMLKQGLARVLVAHPKAHGLDHTLLSLADGDALAKFAKTPVQGKILTALRDDKLNLVHTHEQLAQLQEMQQLEGMEDELDAEEKKRLEFLWVVFLAVKGDAIVAAAKRIANAFGQWWNTLKTSLSSGKGLLYGLAVASANLVKDVAASVNSVIVAVGEFVVSVVTAIGNAITAFVDFLISLLSCFGWGTCAKVGYGFKFPPDPKTIGVWLGITMVIGTDLKKLLQHGDPGDSAVGIDMAVAVGFIPKFLRLGVGIGMSVTCPVGSRQGNCLLEIAVGVVFAIGLPLLGGHPKCVIGPQIGPLVCAQSYGVVLKIFCCKIDLVTGCASCGSSPCDSAGGQSAPSGDTKAEIDRKVASGSSSCKEKIKGKGANYRGCQVKTSVNSWECQKWISSFPHNDPQTRTWAYANQRGLGDHNFCRNPNNRPTIWCYTTKPSVTWATCVPFERVPLNYIQSKFDRRGLVDDQNAELYAHSETNGQPGRKMTLHPCWRSHNFANCQWWFEESSTRYGFYYFKSSWGGPTSAATTGAYIHAAGGTHHGCKSTLHQCWKNNDYPNCQWHVEPSTSRPGKWYLRGSDQFTFLHAHGGHILFASLTMHYCWKNQDYYNCQWGFTSFNLKMYLAGYLSAIDRAASSIHAHGGTYNGKWLTMHACHSAHQYPNCMWSLEESETRQGLWYIKGVDRDTFLHASGGCVGGAIMTMHYCWKGSNYINCQWGMLGSLEVYGKHYLRCSHPWHKTSAYHATAGKTVKAQTRNYFDGQYVHAAYGTVPGHRLTLHPCWKAHNFKNCQWTLTVGWS